jgi:hypothetical protein
VFFFLKAYLDYKTSPSNDSSQLYNRILGISQTLTPLNNYNQLSVWNFSVTNAGLIFKRNLYPEKQLNLAIFNTLFDDGRYLCNVLERLSTFKRKANQD